MFRELLTRLRQGKRTVDFPAGEPPALPARFRGRPLIDRGACADGCRACAESCPTDAIALDGEARVDLGKCLFCGECAAACPPGAVRYASDHRLATRTRQALVVAAGEELELARALDERLRRLFGRSLRLRVVSAGGCNGCELDVNVLSTVVWDLARFGIQYVASPRHADGLLVTGPVTENMALALRKTWDAVPAPRIVVAVGACAISGGPFLHQSQQLGGADSTVPVDLYVPGCPPHPLTILDGLLRLLGRLEESGRLR